MQIMWVCIWAKQTPWPNKSRTGLCPRNRPDTRCRPIRWIGGSAGSANTPPLQRPVLLRKQRAKAKLSKAVRSGVCRAGSLEPAQLSHQLERKRNTQEFPKDSVHVVFFFFSYKMLQEYFWNQNSEYMSCIEGNLFSASRPACEVTQSGMYLNRRNPSHSPCLRERIFVHLDAVTEPVPATGDRRTHPENPVRTGIQQCEVFHPVFSRTKQCMKNKPFAQHILPGG